MSSSDQPEERKVLHFLPPELRAELHAQAEAAQAETVLLHHWEPQYPKPGDVVRVVVPVEGGYQEVGRVHVVE